MLNLIAAYIRFFGIESIENWLNSEDSFLSSAMLWYIAAGLGVLFLLIIIFTFFKAIKRTRQRAVERRIANEVAAATRDVEKEEKKKSKRVKKSSVSEQPQTQPPVVVVAGGEAPSNRVLKGITLDQGVVQREFRVGEDFNCDGLVVNASYSAAPFQEVYADAAAVDASTFELAVKGALSGLYVCAPDMSRPGKKTIRVCFNKQLAVYTISVVAAKAAATAQPQVQGYAPQAQGYAPQVQEQLGPRQMVSLQISAEHARRDFFVGDNFVYDGLMVTAIYNREPVREQVYNFTVVPPDMSRPGNPTVVVMCQDRASSYTISVRENPYAQPKQAPQPQKERVLTRVSLNSDFAKKDYMVGEMFSSNGLSVIAHYNVEPLEEQVSNFNVLPPDMSREGMATVMVAYQDRMLSYQIMIRPNPNAVKPASAPVVEEPKAVRELLSVTLDTGAVSREFEVGEEFNCDGLILNAHYNVAPMNEVKTDFNIVDAKSFDQIIKQTKGCFVAEPDMSAAGRKVVRASLDGQVAVYTITVRAAKAAAATVAEQAKAARELLSITLDLGVVQREFSVDDEFNCDGLLVNANYSAAPMTETRTDCNILDDRSFDKIVNHTKGCFVAEPDMSVAGRKVVRVSLDGVLAIYTISVRPAVKKQVVAEPVQPVVQPAPAPVQAAPAPVVQEPVQPAVPRELLSVTLDLGVVQREFEVGDEFNCDGLLVNANYSTAPMTETRSDCMIVDASNFDQVIKQTDGLFVAEPVMVSAGRKVVRVSLNNRLALYTILVREKKVEQPAPAPVAQPEPQPQPVYVAPTPAQPTRSLLYVTLTTDRVKTNYTVGDNLNTSGLVMNAHYNAEPFMEQVTSYTVSAPDMSRPGIYTVGVQYQDKMVGYQIVINPAPVVEAKPEPQPAPAPQPAPVAQPERTLLYVTLAIDKVQTNYTVGDNLNTAGLVMNAHYNAEPYMEQVTSYNVTAPDMSRPGIYTVGVQYQGKTVGYQIMVNPAPVVETKPEPQPVVVEQPQQQIIVQQPQPQIIVEQPQPQVIVQQPQVIQQSAPSTVVYEEESYEGILRYDRSFNARIIQSDDKTKYWYTDIKNALLSYKKVHGRISWKRETFKCGKIVVAKLSFRGNTLVIMLPLDVAKYAGSKYDLEDVSNAPSNADTPAMMRLKNDKRVKQALELIEVVMAEQGIAKDKKFEAQDYYVPYEGVFELIKKGLIKREIKSAADEAVFTGGQEEDDGEDELVEVAPGVFVSPKK